jgi:hypothetical protein
MRLKPGIPLAALLAFAGWGSAQDSLEVKYKGAAWLQFGRVMHSTDSLVNGGPPNNMNGNWLEATGVTVSSVAKFSPTWEGAMGMGVQQAHNARGDISVANNWYPTWAPFVGEARVTYANQFTETQKLQFNLGYFNYNYNPEAKNLGAYLLRGYVYPGSPISGFEARHTTAASNIFGAMASYTLGSLKNDLLLISETDNRPYFDFSIADVITWKPSASLELGAGFNLYRVLPRNKKNNSPGKDCVNLMSTYSQIDADEREVCYILDTLSVDTAAQTAVVDTLLGSMSGEKLMGRFRFDPKALLGLEGTWGKQDLVLYGEVGVLGLKNYKKYYSDITRRMPMMIGFNIPAMGFLDKFALEVEYYGSKNMLDYGKAETSYSWVPRTEASVDNARDDIKWSLYLSKVVIGHIRLSGQVANDHLRMFGPPDIGFTSYAETLTTPKDWYWMLKSTYFF